MTNASSAAASTIDQNEAARFGAMAADWWDPDGSSAMLHRLMPARMRYIRQRIDLHWGGDPSNRTPLAGCRALDVGCGAGLVSEPLARLGAAVTGIDAAPENIAVAREHAAGQALEIDYRCGGIEDLNLPPFDLVVALEVVEHVADPAGFVGHLARCLAPDGLLILSTPNRTALSRLALITIGESIGGIPPGTHDWSRFLTPDELGRLIADTGLAVDDVTGLSLDPARGFVTGRGKALNYLVAVRHGSGRSAFDQSQPA